MQSRNNAILSLLAFLLLAAAPTAFAQVRVDVALKRNVYLAYEPLIATVIITNNSGAELHLADDARNKWFSVQVEGAGGHPLTPIGTYSNEPLTIQPGDTVRRPINITPLFPLGEHGNYRITAVIYSDGRHYSSAPLGFQISNGRKIWEETVGIPGEAAKGQRRTYTLLTHHLPNSTMLYLRVRDPDTGAIYCTSQLGRIVLSDHPEAIVDTKNHVHILHMIAPKQYLYSVFDLNGKLVPPQLAYQATTKRNPVLTRLPDGRIAVIGGEAYDPNAPAPATILPGLGDSPVPLPAATPEPTKKKLRTLLDR